MFKEFFGADSTNELPNGKIEVIFRGVTAANFKEFFRAVLDPEADSSANAAALAKAVAEKDRFESGHDAALVEEK